MAIPLYLAMTPEEYAGEASPPRPLAWMACQLSSDGVTQLPDTLPPGSLMTLNDRVLPEHCHMPGVLNALSAWLEKGCYAGLLLDFQRKNNPVCRKLAQALVRLPCRVILTAEYAQGFSCPVLVPPAAPHVPLAEHLTPYRGRELWLEIALDAVQIRVTREGTEYGPGGRDSISLPHRDSLLCCHYRTAAMPDRAEFTLCRTRGDIPDLLALAEKLGVTAAVGLYQELG